VRIIKRYTLFQLGFWFPPEILEEIDAELAEVLMDTEAEATIDLETGAESVDTENVETE
jgi:hypothetical protein